MSHLVTTLVDVTNDELADAGWITAAELAGSLRLSVKTVYRMTADNEIPHLKMRRSYRYNLDAVTKALDPAGMAAGTWAQSSRSLARRRVT